MTIRIKYSDVYRATLADDCGNVGFIGLASDGSAYHVVAPVDIQIARGLKAGNRPDDDTPFGGYRNWHYFECPAYRADIEEDRQRQTDANGDLLRVWAAGLGLTLEIDR